MIVTIEMYTPIHFNDRNLVVVVSFRVFNIQ